MLWFESQTWFVPVIIEKYYVTQNYNEDYILCLIVSNIQKLVELFYSFEIKLLIIYDFLVFWGRAVDSASASVQLTNPDLLTEGLVTLLSMTMESYTCFHGIIITVSSVNSPDHHLPFPRYPIHPQPSKTFWQDECSKLVANYANYWQLP